MQIEPVTMNFRYGEAFSSSPPTAYETLLLDCMLGDATLFNREDAVELSWELVDPILTRWREDGEKGLAFYESGSWGPAEADAFIARRRAFLAAARHHALTHVRSRDPNPLRPHRTERRRGRIVRAGGERSDCRGGIFCRRALGRNHPPPVV